MTSMGAAAAGTPISVVRLPTKISCGSWAWTWGDFTKSGRAGPFTQPQKYPAGVRRDHPRADEGAPMTRKPLAVHIASARPWLWTLAAIAVGVCLWLLTL